MAEHMSFEQKLREAAQAYPQPNPAQLDALGEKIKNKIFSKDSTLKQNKNNSRKMIVRICVSAACIALVVFCFTPAARVMANSVIEYFFPDKPQTVISLEGTDEYADYKGVVVLGGDSATMADYGIYVDREVYSYTVDGALLRIVPSDYTDEDMQSTPVYMTIEQRANTTVEAELAVEKARIQALSPVNLSEETEGELYADWCDWDNYDWSAGCENVTVRSNGKGGVLVIVEHFFMEAQEGHGARLSQMLDTLELLG